MDNLKSNGLLLTLIMAVLLNITSASKNSSQVQMFFGREIKREGIQQKVFKRKLSTINIDEVIFNLRNFSRVIEQKVLILKTLIHEEAVTLLSDVRKYNENMHKLYRCRKVYRGKVKEMLKEMNVNGEPRYLKLLNYMFPVETNYNYSNVISLSISLKPHEIRKLVKRLGRSHDLRHKLNTITKYPL